MQAENDRNTGFQKNTWELLLARAQNELTV